MAGNGGQAEHDPFDVFSQFFGGGQRNNRRNKPSRGPDITMPFRVNLDILYSGKVFAFTIRKQTICPNCRGNGAEQNEDIEVCNECNGAGFKTQTRKLGPGFIQQFQTTCNKCGGKGKIQTSTCHVCDGRKSVFTDQVFDVEIEKGMPDGHQIEFESFGDEYPDRISGNLYIEINTPPHPIFTRDGDDLWLDMVITLRESLVGFKKEFTHLDNRKVQVVRDRVTEPREVIVLENEGMPKFQSSSEKGNLNIKIEVIFPETLTPTQKEGFRKIFGA